MEWACTDENSGFANRYELDLSELEVVQLSGADYNILNWLAILLANRTFRLSNDLAAEGRDYMLDTYLPDTSYADIIVGYRADDSYFAFANAFLNNTLSLEQLEKAMYLGKLGEQVVLVSEKAFQHIAFTGSEIANRDVYYPLKTERDKEARRAYRRESSARRASDAVYMLDILRGGWSNDDERLRRNVPG